MSKRPVWLSKHSLWFYLILALIMMTSAFISTKYLSSSNTVSLSPQPVPEEASPQVESPVSGAVQLNQTAAQKPTEVEDNLGSLLARSNWKKHAYKSANYRSFSFDGSNKARIVLLPSSEDDKLIIFTEKNDQLQDFSSDEDLKFQQKDSSLILLFIPNGWQGKIDLNNNAEVSGKNFIHSGELKVVRAEKMAFIDSMVASFYADAIDTAQLWGFTGREKLELNTYGGKTDLTSVNSSTIVKIIHSGDTGISAMSVGAPQTIIISEKGSISYASNEPDTSYILNITDKKHKKVNKTSKKEAEQYNKNLLELTAPQGRVETRFGDGSCPSDAARGLDLENCLVPYVK